MTGSDWIAVASLVVALIGVVVVVYQLRQVSLQIRLQNFSDYTKRYQEIVLNLPEDVNDVDFSLTSERGDYEKTMRFMRAYFDLCYEEWFLDTHKLVNPKFWSVWKGGIETALSKPAFRQAWSKVKLTSEFGAAFVSFMDERASR